MRLLLTDSAFRARAGLRSSSLYKELPCPSTGVPTISLSSPGCTYHHGAPDCGAWLLAAPFASPPLLSCVPTPGPPRPSSLLGRLCSGTGPRLLRAFWGEGAAVRDLAVPPDNRAGQRPRSGRGRGRPFLTPCLRSILAVQPLPLRSVAGCPPWTTLLAAGASAAGHGQWGYPSSAR